MKMKRLILAGMSVITFGFPLASKCEAGSFVAYDYGNTVIKKYKQELENLAQERKKHLPTICENLEKISTDTPTSEIEKISYLWKQFRDATPEQIEQWNEHYLQIIDTLDPGNIESDDVQVDKEKLDKVIHFFIEYNQLFADNSLFERRENRVIVRPGLSKNLPIDVDRNGKILEGKCSTEKIQYAMKLIQESIFSEETDTVCDSDRKCINQAITAFQSKESRKILKENLKEHFKSERGYKYGYWVGTREKTRGQMIAYSKERKFELFISALGEDSRFLYEPGLSGLSSEVQDLFHQIIQEVKSAYNYLIATSQNFSDESKKKLSSVISSISVNDQSIFPNRNYLQQLNVTEDFTENMMSLVRIQQESASKENVQDRNIPESITEETNSKAHVNFNSIVVPINDIYKFEQISKLKGLAKSLKISSNECLQDVLFFTLAHEMGHMLDKILGMFEPNEISKSCSEHEQKIMMSKKELLNTRFELLCEKKGLSNTIKDFHSKMTQSEIWADALAYEAMNVAAKNKGYNQTRIAALLKSPIFALFPFFENFQSLDHVHPVNKIRFDLTITASSFADEFKQLYQVDEIFQHPDYFYRFTF